MNNKLAFATGVFAAALGTLGVLYPGAGDDLRSLYDAILFWAPVILPAAGGLLLGLLRRQTAGSTVAGALAGVLGAGLATFAVAVYIVVDCSINPDACSELGAVGVLFVYLSIGAALLASSALLSGVGSWFTHFVPIGNGDLQRCWSPSL